MLKKQLLFIPILLGLILCVFAQQRKISGKIAGVNGEPLAGASVNVKKSRSGTSSSADGSFTISAADNAVLVITAVGYEPKEINIGTEQFLSIEMSTSTRSLDEIVVTALGVKREKRVLTFSSQEVKGDEILRSKEPNVVNALAGKVSGVQITNSTGTPGSSSRIIVRGVTSINGPNEALIVLDGVPIDNSETGAVNNGPGSNRLVDIDPSIIESINVLKGAAATALYGSAGARGVVMITTKNGSANKAALVTLSSDLSFDSPIFPEMQRKYSQGEGGVYYNGEDRKTSSSWGALMDTLKVNGQAIQKHNPMKEFFKNGITTNNTISVSGSNTNSNYFVSYSYFNQQGTVPTTDFIRHSVFTKFTNKIMNDLTATVQFNYSNSKSDRQPEGYNLESPIWTVYTAPISWNPLPYLNADGTQRVYRFSRNNPYWVLDNINTKGNVNRFLPVATINYASLPWLSVTERIGTDIYNEQVKYYEAPGSSANINGVLVDRSTNFRQYNHDLIIDARKQFHNFTVDVLVGNNILSSYTQVTEARGVGLAIVGFDNMSNASTQTYKENHYLQRKVGFYTQANIEYKKLLVLGLTGRYDGSSVLSKDKNFYPYGSASMSFLFSELFTTPSSIINFGKLRASYATVGNDNIGAYQLSTPYSVATVGTITFPFQGQSGFLLNNTLGNPTLTNELAKEFEIGLETKLINNTIGLEVSYFDKRIENGLIPNVSIAPSTGFTNTNLNSALLETKGIELLLNATPVKTKKFIWGLTFNYTRLRNKVLSLGELQQFNIGFTQAVVGQPYGVIFGDMYKRAATGELLIDADGLPFKAESQGILGNVSPDWLAGLTNTLHYGQFGLSFFFDMKKGGDIQNNVDGYGYFYGTPKATEDRGLRVVPGISVVDNKQNTKQVDGQTYYRRLSGILESVIQDGTYIKLRNVTLSYDLSKSLLPKMFFQSASLVLTGRNLWIHSPHFTGADPETNSFGSSNANQGLYSFSVPTNRSLSVSLKLTF